MKKWEFLLLCCSDRRINKDRDYEIWVCDKDSIPFKQKNFAVFRF